MSQQIAIRIPEEELRELDAAVDRGSYPTRAAAVRAALELLLGAEREREIADQYRRAYADHPQDEWIAKAGADAMGEVLAEGGVEARVDPPR